jgi:hypothetical protein
MDRQNPRWTFLSNHARVLLALARNPTARLQDVATGCRISERTAQRIVADLELAGYLSRRRDSRHHEYTVHRDQPLRYPADTGLLVRDLLKLLGGLADEQSEPGGFLIHTAGSRPTAASRAEQPWPGGQDATGTTESRPREATSCALPSARR